MQLIFGAMGHMSLASTNSFVVKDLYNVKLYIIMNTLSRTLTGTFAIILGVVLIVVGFFEPFVWIYGIPILIIGIFIFFNKGEDNIEMIKGGKK